MNKHLCLASTLGTDIMNNICQGTIDITLGKQNLLFGAKETFQL